MRAPVCVSAAGAAVARALRVSMVTAYTFVSPLQSSHQLDDGFAVRAGVIRLT